MILFSAFCLYAVFILGSMATMSIGAGLLGIAMVLHFRGPRGVARAFAATAREDVFRRQLIFTTAFFAALTLSIIVAKVYPLGYGGVKPRIDLGLSFSKLWYLIWPFALGVGLRELSGVQRRRVLSLWFLAFVCFSFVAIAQYFWGWPHPQEIPSSQPIRYHATAFTGHHLSLASIWIFPMFAALDYAWMRRSKLYAVIAGIGILTLILSFARSVWISLPIGLLFYGLMRLPKRQAVALGIFLALVCGAAASTPVVQDRMRWGAINQRVRLWEAHWQFFKDRPLTGAGFRNNIGMTQAYFDANVHGEDIFASHAHNNVLDLLGSAGLPGLLTWLLWAGFPVWLVWRLRGVGIKKDSEIFATGLLAAWLVYHLNGMTQVNFWEGKVLHQFCWMYAWTLFWYHQRRALT